MYRFGLKMYGFGMAVCRFGVVYFRIGFSPPNDNLSPELRSFRLVDSCAPFVTSELLNCEHNATKRGERNTYTQKKCVNYTRHHS